MFYSSDPGNPASATPSYQAGSAFKNFTAANAGVQLATGFGSARRIVVGAAGTSVALYDGTSSAGAPITIFSTTAIGSYELDCVYAVGLFAIVVVTGNVTIVWK